jgi:hypothetical protein
MSNSEKDGLVSMETFARKTPEAGAPSARLRSLDAGELLEHLESKSAAFRSWDPWPRN